MGSSEVEVAPCSSSHLRRWNSAAKMSGAMALVASSRCSGARLMGSGGGPKRRSLAECGAAPSTTTTTTPHPYSLRKRPRTNRDRKPHPNPSFLLLPPSPGAIPPLLMNCTSPSPPPSPSLAPSPSHPPVVSATCPASLPPPPSSVFFVKTEPLQNLAVVLPDAIDDDEFACFAPSFDMYDDDGCGGGDQSILTPSAPAASFFPAIEHLLIDNNCNSNIHDNKYCVAMAPAENGSICAENSNSCSTITCSSSSGSALQSPVSPLSSTSAFCSYSSDGGGGGIITAWDDCAPAEEASCDFFCSDSFYEIEKEMSCIMGDHASNQEVPVDVGLLIINAAHPTTTDPLLQKQQIRCSSSSSSSTCHSDVVQVKVESEYEQNSSESSPQPTEDCSTAVAEDVENCRTSTALLLSETEEEYSIDLMDFEPESGAASSASAATNAADLDSQLLHKQCSSESTSRLSLKLNVEELIREWSDRAPLITDGSERPAAIELDLSAWQPENQMMAAQQGWEVVGVGKMIRLPEAEAGATPPKEGEEAAPAPQPSAVQRQASVLRYREKRRTRLFAKKIRYEVRKLNAERRPRMKGRFIKRTSLD